MANEFISTVHEDLLMQLKAPLANASVASNFQRADTVTQVPIHIPAGLLPGGLSTAPSHALSPSAITCPKSYRPVSPVLNGYNCPLGLISV